MADFDEAIRLAPKDATAYDSRAGGWSDQKEYDKAIADYGEAIRLDSKNAASFNNRGVAWAFFGTIADKAILELRRGHPRSTPSAPSAYYNRGIMVRQDGRPAGRLPTSSVSNPIRLEPPRRSGLLQPRQHLVRQDGVRQGDRRLWRGHPTRPQR